MKFNRQTLKVGDLIQSDGILYKIVKPTISVGDVLNEGIRLGGDAFVKGPKDKVVEYQVENWNLKARNWIAPSKIQKAWRAVK